MIAGQTIDDDGFLNSSAAKCCTGNWLRRPVTAHEDWCGEHGEKLSL